MRLLKLAEKLDAFGCADQIDQIDRELLRLAQTAEQIAPPPAESPLAMPPPPSMAGAAPMGADPTGAAATPPVDPADSQIYDQLGKHILKNKQEHEEIYQKLRELEERMYNLTQKVGVEA